MQLILLHLNLGILAWDYWYGHLTNLQKKVIRIICLAKYIAHKEPIFKERKILKIEDILRQQELKFYYEFKNIKLPHCLQALPIHFNTDSYHHETWTQHNIRPVTNNHEYAKNVYAATCQKSSIIPQL